MIGEKEIPQWKLDEVKQLVELFHQHKNVAVIEVARLNDKQVQDIRKNLRNKAVLRMSKKNLQLRAVDQYKNESNMEHLDDLAANIPGQAALCFTNLDIFDLKKIFNENLWMVPAKPNDNTPVDIWVPAGDTGLPTGQVISELNMTLRLPTRLQNDTIWIREDTMTHKAGDFVDVKQAAVLKKLGITPVESLIKIHYAWCDGEIFTSDILYMDTEQFQKDILSCYQSAQAIALELGIIDDSTLDLLTQRAHCQALHLLYELPIIDESMMDSYVQKAVANSSVLNSIIFGIEVSSSSQPEQDRGKEEKPEKEEEEEDVGISGLFGGE